MQHTNDDAKCAMKQRFSMGKCDAEQYIKLHFYVFASCYIYSKTSKRRDDAERKGKKTKKLLRKWLKERAILK